MKTLKTWTFLQGVEGKDRPQKDIWKLPTNLGVQGSHSPCFYQEIDQTDREPERKFSKDMRNSVITFPCVILNIKLTSPA